MKRIFLSAIISLGLHGLLFSMETQWVSGIHATKPESRQITISLVQQLQQKSEIKPSPKYKPRYVRKRKPVKKAAKPPVMQNKKKPVETTPKPEAEKSIPVEQTKEEYVNSDYDIPPISYSTTVNQKAETPGDQTVVKARPIYRINPPPSYPMIARKRGYQGHVVLKVLINKQGKVIDLNIFSSSGYSILDKTAAASVIKWLFKPGMRGSEKIQMWVKVPIRFKLN